MIENLYSQLVDIDMRLMTLLTLSTKPASTTTPTNFVFGHLNPPQDGRKLRSPLTQTDLIRVVMGLKSST